ncbi:hypothetical protein [Streptomyces sp. NPDC001410]|uniref:hypothetical protein n=1 Tax=Streptomyces sp. NPDC001410 TaxID=3364574 RepID=UPI0036BAE9F0
MDVYLEATIAPLDPAERGKVVVGWFEATLSGPLADLVWQEERAETGVYTRTSVWPSEGRQRIHMPHLGRNRHRLNTELAKSPEWAITEFYGEDVLGRVQCSYFAAEGEWSQFVVALEAGASRLADSAYCTSLVDFLAQALDDLDPIFARIEYDVFSDWSNIEAVLNRGPDESLPEGREFLRGYAWVTVCPEELAERLGGSAALSVCGAFHQVVPLRAGGVLLQATETLAGYTDEAMERVFRAIAPVLPEGEPCPDPAHPEHRFVPLDAAQLR